MKNIALLILTLSILSSTACDKSENITWVLENSLDETVKTELFYIPFNYPVQPMEKGEYTLKAFESLTLAESGSDPRSEYSPLTALIVFYGIQRPDSLIITFGNGKKLYYTVQDSLDPLNPLNVGSRTSAWTPIKRDKDNYFNKFYITDSHKSIAQ
jgi:hypothetical protein